MDVAQTHVAGGGIDAPPSHPRSDSHSPSLPRFQPAHNLISQLRPIFFFFFLLISIGLFPCIVLNLILFLIRFSFLVRLRVC